MDSGASAHMVPCKELLEDITVINGKVSLGDAKQKLDITCCGKSRIEILGKVLCVPRLSFGLISLSALDKIGCQTVIKDGKMVISIDGKTILTGTLINNLYHLDSVYRDIILNDSCGAVIELFVSNKKSKTDLNGSNKTFCDSDEVFNYSDRVTELNDDMEVSTDLGSTVISNIKLESLNLTDKLVSGSAPSRFKSTLLDMEPMELLHLRLGHMSENKIKIALKNGMLNGMQYTYDDIKDCTLGYVN